MYRMHDLIIIVLYYAGIIMTIYHGGLVLLAIFLGKRFFYSRFGQNVMALSVVFKPRETWNTATSSVKFIIRHILRCIIGLLLVKLALII